MTHPCVPPRPLKVWVKYHFKTDQGIRNLSAGQAGAMQGTDPDYAIQDLYNSIAEGDHPSWTVYVQVHGVTRVSHARGRFGGGRLFFCWTSWIFFLSFLWV